MTFSKTRQATVVRLICRARFSLWLTVLCVSAAGCGHLNLEPWAKVEMPLAKARVAVPAQADSTVLTAAADLRRHLRMFGGNNPPLTHIPEGELDEAPAEYTLYVGINPKGQPSAPPKDHHGRGRYFITENAVYLYAADAPRKEVRELVRPPVHKGQYCSALQGAVTAFLRNELGCRWLAPGDDWITCSKTAQLKSGKPIVAKPGGQSSLASQTSIRLENSELFTPPQITELNRWYSRFGIQLTAVTSPAFAGRLRSLPLPLGDLGSSYRLARDIRAGKKPDTKHLRGAPGFFVPRILEDYVTLRALAPAAPDLETLMKDYCTAFGPAAAAVREYYSFWMRHYEDTVRPHISKARKYRRHSGLTRQGGATYLNVAKLYPDSVVRKSAAVLHKAAQKGLNEVQRKRLDYLLLMHAHDAMLLSALRSLNPAQEDPDRIAQGIQNALRLRDFRHDFKGPLGPGTAVVQQQEKELADITGVDFSGLFEEPESKPVMRLGPGWFAAPPAYTENDADKALNATSERVTEWPVWTDTQDSLPPGAREPNAKWLAGTFSVDGNPFEKEYALHFWALARPVTVYMNGQKVGQLPPQKFTQKTHHAWRLPLPAEAFVVEENEQIVMLKFDAGARPAPVSAWRAVWLVEDAGDTE